MAFDYGDVDAFHTTAGDGFDETPAADSNGAYAGPSGEAGGGIDVDEVESFADQAPQWMTDDLFSDELVSISEDDWQVDADDIWDIGSAPTVDDIDGA